jgi:hypothetical protein
MKALISNSSRAKDPTPLGLQIIKCAGFHDGAVFADHAFSYGAPDKKEEVRS